MACRRLDQQMDCCAIWGHSAPAHSLWCVYRSVVPARLSPTRTHSVVKDPSSAVQSWIGRPGRDATLDYVQTAARKKKKRAEGECGVRGVVW